MRVEHATLNGVAFPEAPLKPRSDLLVPADYADCTGTVGCSVDPRDHLLASVIEKDPDRIAVLSEKTADAADAAKGEEFLETANSALDARCRPPSKCPGVLWR